MKQIAAILLLGIFSFNLFGYRIVASWLEKTENTKIEIALDKNEYSDDQLISIKQPINLPYYNNTKDFQRVDGEVEIAGIHYKYVKCRIYNDSLELLCIPNTAKMKIQATKADFSEMASGVQQSTGEDKKSLPGSKSFHKVVSEYEAPFQSATSFRVTVAHNFFPTESSFKSILFLQSVEQPPDQSSRTTV